MRLVGEYKPDDFLYLGVADEHGRDQIAYVERGPKDVVVRAMRDVITRLLGEEAETTIVVERTRRALMSTDVRATGVTLDKKDVVDLLRAVARSP
jgi:hypothetical protein